MISEELIRKFKAREITDAEIEELAKELANGIIDDTIEHLDEREEELRDCGLYELFATLAKDRKGEDNESD